MVSQFCLFGSVPLLAASIPRSTHLGRGKGVRGSTPLTSRRRLPRRGHGSVEEVRRDAHHGGRPQRRRPESVGVWFGGRWSDRCTSSGWCHAAPRRTTRWLGRGWRTRRTAGRAQSPDELGRRSVRLHQPKTTARVSRLQHCPFERCLGAAVREVDHAQVDDDMPLDRGRRADEGFMKPRGGGEVQLHDQRHDRAPPNHLSVERTARDELLGDAPRTPRPAARPGTRTSLESCHDLMDSPGALT